jgi:opacity protein-like surface antigen
MKVNERKKSLLLAVFVAAFLSFTAKAQETTPKAEVFGGYSYLQFRSGGEGINGHGFNLSVAGNFNKHIGLVAEVGRQSASEPVNLQDLFGDPSFPNTTVEAKARLVTYLFGPRFSARSDKVTAFAHSLIGGARGSGEATAAGVSGSISDTGFALALGGGLDVNAGKHIAFRIGQVDYLLTKAFGGTRHNFRYSAGLVFRLGSK